MSFWSWLAGADDPGTDPLVAELHARVADKDQEIAYLRALLAREQERAERIREECLVVADRRAAQDVAFYRTARSSPPLKEVSTEPPSRDGIPNYLANSLAEHVEPDDAERPENYGLTDEDLAEQTIEDEQNRREAERLAAVGA